MTLNEREAFEAATNIYHCIYNSELDYYFSGSKFSSDKAEIEVNAGWKAWKARAKAQAVPDTHVIVPKELHIEIAMKMAKERIFKQSAGNDQVWNELVEQAYKDNLQAEQYRLIRDYREMIKASESGAEG